MHILTVYFYASIAAATRPAVYFASLWSSPRPLISPRIIFPMYSTALFIRHASIVHSLLINNSCFHVVCYMPEELWLIFLCGGGLDIPLSSPSPSSNLRDLFQYQMLIAHTCLLLPSTSTVPSITFRPCTLTTSSFRRLRFQYSGTHL